ncbi:hypothetical protein EPUL_004204 [Erysiphe pulchra]|uniref:Uncharacterized protein n=1 Tax=Erysiphe pulchra TaxID=225359 RepID=A0A2S4PPR0_9PEZI|nr:hypothetical protein EPUL_004204 [Erysiphe pulchra]
MAATKCRDFGGPHCSDNRQKEYDAVLCAKAAEESTASVQLNLNLTSSQVSEIDANIHGSPASSVVNSTGDAMRI